MDSDTVDASSLSSVSQPLDVLRLELQNEPAFAESNIPNDDHTLTRFLKARGYNATQAKQMILECIEWRRTVEDVGIEELYRSIDPFDFPGRRGVFECWPMGFHKTDKRGRPIHIQRFGTLSFKRLSQHITPEEHWRTVLVNIEAILTEVFPAASAAAGRPIRQALIIVDLKGLGFSQFWAFKSIARRFFHVSQNYYPETMGQLIILNAPTTFTAMWNVIKPWLAPRTLDKITFVGTCQSEQRATLLDLVSPENLPVALGGTCTCSCSSTETTDASNSTGSGSDSDIDGDSESCSGSSNSGVGGGGGGGCALSNAGPWMDGRAERRKRWLRGEIPNPGVPWPPLQKQEEHVELEQEGHAVEETRDDEHVEEAEAGPIDAPVASAGTGVAAAPSSPSSASCSRTSVVGLPPLTHPPPPAPVRLVV